MTVSGCSESGISVYQVLGNGVLSGSFFRHPAIRSVLWQSLIGEFRGSRTTPRVENCNHSIDPRMGLWLPRVRTGLIVGGDLARHPFCQACGVVATLGRERGLKVGHFINVLSHIAASLGRLGPRAVPLTRAQRGLIVRELSESPTFADPFGVPRNAQVQTFISIVRRFREDLSPGYLRDMVECTRA